MPTQVAAQWRASGAYLPRASRAAARRPGAGAVRHTAGIPATALVALAVLAVGVADTSHAAEGAAAARPGAYCPLPEPGQKPVCLEPAEARYERFFAAVQRGAVTPDDAADVESDLAAGAAGEDAYLALSSLSYGYWRLAEQVGSQPYVDPTLLARLAHWNALMADLYSRAVDDPAFREAVREAATDLHRRTPPSAAPCPNRYPGGCRHTDDLVRALAAVDETAGVRSPLGRLIQRMIGDPEAAGDAIGAPGSEDR